MTRSAMGASAAAAARARKHHSLAKLMLQVLQHWWRAGWRKARHPAPLRLHAPKTDHSDWRAFETQVATYFRRRGFVVTHVGGSGPGGVVDLLLSRGTQVYPVYCQQWRARQVGVGSVRELYATMGDQLAAGGYVVTLGQFTDEARVFAVGRGITLLNGVQLQAGFDRQTEALTD